MDLHEINAEVEFNIEFYDVDSMNIVWHGNYIKYFEKARCALLNKLAYGYNEMRESGYAFPVIDTSVKFVKSLRFGDRARARAVLDEYENRLRIKYEIFNTATGELTTKGQSTQMAVNMKTMDSCFVCPDIFTRKVEALLNGEKCP